MASPIFGERMYGNAKHVRLQSDAAPPRPPVCSMPAVAPKAAGLTSTVVRAPSCSTRERERLTAHLPQVDLGDFNFESATLASLEAAIAAEAAAVEKLVDEESERKRMRHGSPGSVNPRQPASSNGGRPAGTAAEAPPSVDAPWPCSACTFMNPPASPTCAVCSASRAGGGTAAAVAGAGSEWTCSSCTADNAPTLSSCYMCGTARGGGGRGATGV
jgi:hypothetical protein